MDSNRFEELLIQAFEWAINTSEQHTHDLVRATGITSNELEQIGYDIDNFKNMHDAANEE